MQKRIIEAVALDLNGNILDDGHAFYYEGYIPGAERMGIEMPDFEDVRHAYSVLGPDAHIAQLAEEQRVMTKIDDVGDENRFVTYRDDILPYIRLRVRSEQSRISRGAVKAIEYCAHPKRQIPLALISAMSHDAVVDLLKAKDLFDYFLMVKGASPDVEMNKAPYLRKFRELVHIPESQAQRLWFFSDMTLDLIQGRQAGCTVVAYPWGYGSYESLEAFEVNGRVEKPHRIMRRWSEFPNLGEFRRRTWTD